MLNPYKSSPRPKIGRSVFNLSYTKKFTCDMGELIPVMVDEMVPGDIWSIGHNVVLRFNPLLAPLLHEVYLYIETFFVPYRILLSTWEDFITGGEDGTDTSTIPTYNTSANTAGTLWDYMGMPTGINAATGGKPTRWPWYAYCKIWNDYYRDETQQTELDITSTASYVLQIRNYAKDYFTSALPWEQRGTAPALPLSGTAAAEDDGTSWQIGTASDLTGEDVMVQNSTDPSLYVNSYPSTGGQVRWVNSGLEVDFSNAGTFDVNDIRLAFQMQKMLERGATGGARYTEYLQSMYGISNGDSRLQRPEWIGGLKTPCIFSEVLQTSEDGTTPQGNMAGHGISVGRKKIGNYRAKEFGVIMSLLSVMPKAAYSQGVNRQWLRSTRWDYYNPLLANLGEQAITHAELYTSATEADNISVFGYQGRYNEMRSKHDMVAGDLRYGETYDYWHLGRHFSSKPSLNSDFLEYDGRKDIFAASSEDGLIVNCGNIIKAVRPIPVLPNPGYIDH